MKGDASFVELKGILSGIVADQEINEKELLFLDTWIRDRQENFLENGDVVDLLDVISDVLEDGVITQEESSDTLALIDCILEHTDDSSVYFQLEELFGFVRGILSDEVIKEQELNTLKERLAKLLYIPLCSLLNNRLKTVFGDELISLLKSFSGHYFEETGSSCQWSTFLSDSLPDEYSFSGKKVCFTGGVTDVPRSVLKQNALNSGATVCGNVSRNTDILVVGDGCNKDWISGSFGRKLERAFELKNEGYEILVIPAEQWLGAVLTKADPKKEVRDSAWSSLGDSVNIDGIYMGCCKAAEKTNLHVEKSVETDCFQSVSLHRCWKSGKPLKKKELFIEYRHDEFETSRPWVVGGVGITTSSFKEQHNAVEKFRNLSANLIADYSSI